jgi:DNA-binding transcriptional MocR family regulator
LENVGEICRANLKYLRENARKNWKINNPAGGTFACIFFEGNALGSDNLRRVWLKEGVHVAAGRSFFMSNANEGVPFLRVSLCREIELFTAAIDRLGP